MAAVIEVPQADNLARIRLAVQAIAEGERATANIARALGVTERNVAYALQAARALGLLNGQRLTALGEQLIATVVGSEGERACLRRAISESPVVVAVAPALLGAEAPSSSALAAAIAKAGGLGQATAERRAQTLLSWREQVLDGQGLLFD